MKNKLLHTPEGVRDIYGAELERKELLENRLKSLIKSYGYKEIETPTFEYFDIFSKDTGITSSREVYKFFDRENNTLALRPDFTPGVARAAVKYFFEDEAPKRLCYLGKTFSNHTGLQGKLKEVTELGLEYLGEPSADADAEMINIAVDLLKGSGLTDFQICVGNAEYFKGLCEGAGLDPDTVSELSENIRNKNYFGTMDALNDAEVPESIKNTLSSFPDFFGYIEILDEAERKVRGIKRSEEAVKRLKELYDRLKAYGVQDYITFDLGMLSKHDYYTGVIFRAYTFGTGDAIIRGGRYDKLLSNFGRDRAAVGFTLIIDQLLSTLKRQNIEGETEREEAYIYYDSASFATALKKARELREKGILTAMTRLDDGTDPSGFHKGDRSSLILYYSEGKEKKI
ncbi:MAG: ATP phosphoribosyltransferase regulatory subunit [Lachnospiraceae bacterium]|nr:ATP phosphoribosyltransferase regulatory subunit [Lachnospiraceae bacterium]